MDRATAAAFLESQPSMVRYAEDLQLYDWANLRSVYIWASVIDATWRELGLDPVTDDVPSDRDDDCRLLLRFFALDMFTELYSSRVDINMSQAGLAKQRSQAYKAVKERRDDALSLAQDRGLLAGLPQPAGALTVGRMTLDFLEPVSSEGF